jgi:molybdopterin-guanine dinucleotide biosynthesis protein A
MTRHGFLQAGGASARFGRDKALVSLAGKRMLQRTGELLASVCDDVTIVAPSGKYADEPWPVLRDRWPGQGPLGGILTALQRVMMHSDESRMTNIESSSAWALILSCDMPFLTQEFLAFLWTRASTSSAQVIVPESASGLEPLCSCWRVDSLATVQTAFDAGIRKTTEAMKQLRMEVLDEAAWKRFDSHNRLFWNMNTPEDYEYARRVLETEAHE